MINMLQIIVMIPLFVVTLPANAALFFRELMALATFNLIDITPFLNNALDMNAGEPMNGSYATVGFESLYLLHNIGSFLMAFMVFLAEVLFSLFLRKASVGKQFKLYGDQINESLFFTQLLTFMFESYSVLCMSCFINIRSSNWDSPGQGIQSALAFLVLIYLIALPFAVGFFLQIPGVLKDPHVKAKYSKLYPELRLKG